jgi:hypothetical protein
MKLWISVLVLTALSILAYASQGQAPKRTNEEEIAALKRRVAALENSLNEVRRQMADMAADIYRPKLLPAQ